MKKLLILLHIIQNSRGVDLICQGSDSKNFTLQTYERNNATKESKALCPIQYLHTGSYPVARLTKKPLMVSLVLGRDMHTHMHTPVHTHTQRAMTS